MITASLAFLVLNHTIQGGEVFLVPTLSVGMCTCTVSLSDMNIPCVAIPKNLSLAGMTGRAVQIE